jgi:hypothetical protein
MGTLLPLSTGDRGPPNEVGFRGDGGKGAARPAPASAKTVVERPATERFRVRSALGGLQSTSQRESGAAPARLLPGAPQRTSGVVVEVTLPRWIADAFSPRCLHRKSETGAASFRYSQERRSRPKSQLLGTHVNRSLPRGVRSHHGSRRALSHQAGPPFLRLLYRVAHCRTPRPSCVDGRRSG